MLENFTDRSRRVLQLAKQEAERLGHNWVGTEHLLLGMVKEGSGVAATVLTNLGVGLPQARAETLNLLGIDKQAAPEQESVETLWTTPDPETPMTIKQELDKLGVTEAVKKLIVAGYNVERFDREYGDGWKAIDPADLDDSLAKAAWELYSLQNPGVDSFKECFVSGFEAGRARCR